MILTAVVGVTLERVAYRPLRRKGVNRLYVVITALMCGLILENGNLALLGASRKSFPTLIPTKVFDVFGVTVTNIKLMQFDHYEKVPAALAEEIMKKK